MKKYFLWAILFPGLLNAQVEMGVVTPPILKPPTLKPGAFIDKNGDTITVLDPEAREKINAVKNIKATNVYDNEAAIEKYKTDYEKKVLADSDLKYGVYTVVKGDSLKVISQKLYGTTKKWKELQVLNEDKLHDTNVKTGMKLKYIQIEKEVENGNNNSGQKDR